jgi:hypothetical protein
MQNNTDSASPTPATDPKTNGRLVPKMFFGHTPDEWLGLASGQVHSENLIVEEARWFNGKGALLGQGDLVFDDVRRIMHGLEEDEVFIILLEGSRLDDDVDRSDEPSLEYILGNANYVFTQDKAYFVSDNKLSAGKQDGIEFECMLEQSLRELLEKIK